VGHVTVGVSHTVAVVRAFCQDTVLLDDPCVVKLQRTEEGSVAVIVVVDPLLTRPGALDEHTFPGHRLVALDPRYPEDGGEALAEAAVLLTAIAPVDRALLARAPRLGMVAKPGAGVDNIDLESAAERGVLVCHAPGTRGQAVAEYVVWALLELAKRSATADGRTTTPLDLAGTTLGLVGLGDIGARVARVATALEMDVVAATRSRRPPAGLDVRFAAIDQIHREVDALVLCAPLAPDTTGLVSARTLAEMRAGSVVVNVARGRCVVTADLTDALSEGRLRGAALDVSDPEPLPPDHPLRHMRNVIVTDHVAGRTPLAQRRAVARMVGDVRAFLDGRRPEHVVGTGATTRHA
jgi:phosphoglycerate dehydrogenase-like enzyme